MEFFDGVITQPPIMFGFGLLTGSIVGFPGSVAIFLAGLLYYHHDTHKPQFEPRAWWRIF